MSTNNTYWIYYIVSLRQEKALSRAEGKAEAKLETARNFKSLGVDMATISKATGLSVEEIEAL